MRRYHIVLLFIFLAGIFLRFYKLDAFVTFLGDQGRDAIIIKRLLSFEHFPAIGPTTSVGGIFLGPFFYYFISPWLFFFRFDPLGPAIGVAVFSSLYILINYFTVKELIDEKTALISSILISFSYILIDFSRFSWNPNLLPLFTLLTVYFLVKSFRNFEWRDFILTGAFLSFSIQLHYLALILFLPTIIFIVWKIIASKKKIKELVLKSLSTAASFFLFSSPLLIFDLRHNFLNSKNFLGLFKNSGTIGGDKLVGLLNSFFYLNKFTLNIELNDFFLAAFVFLILISFILLLKNKSTTAVFFLFFILVLGGLSLYSGPKHPHYLGILYPLYFVIIAYFLSQLSSSVVGYVLITVFLGAFIFLNSQNYSFLKSGGSYQIQAARKTAQIIFDNIRVKNYTLTALPEVYSDHTTRYFLELWGKRPQERGDTKKASELFVICETLCKPIGAPIWDIAHFAPTKITGEWHLNNATIYRLSH